MIGAFLVTGHLSKTILPININSLENKEHFQQSQLCLKHLPESVGIYKHSVAKDQHIKKQDTVLENTSARATHPVLCKLQEQEDCSLEKASEHPMFT